MGAIFAFGLIFGLLFVYHAAERLGRWLGEEVVQQQSCPECGCFYPRDENVCPTCKKGSK